MPIRSYSILIIMLVFLNSWGQGWRPGEMEVMVYISHSSDFKKMQGLGLDYETASPDGRMLRLYLVPGELKLLQENQVRHEVTISDMNRHFEHFWDNSLVPSGYYTYEEIIAIADSLAANFPAICQKVSWGTSLGGRQLAALKISDNTILDEPEAEIMFDGGIHGDEVGGPQNLIMFARDLCLAYGSDPAVTDLIDNREIWLYLMVNPDGRASMSRYNNNFVDCNRDNGYMWDAEGNSPGAFSQVETKALRNGILDNQFVVYTDYHSGTEALSFPWSYRGATARDYLHINQIAGAYSNSSGYGSLQYGQGYNIMYAINGSTKDFVYGSLGNPGWTMEISMAKQPPASQIGYYYNANKPAMLEIIKQCGWGVTGIVTDSLTGESVSASVWIDNLFPVYTDPLAGDYHKFVVPGNWTVKIMANGYQSKTISNVTVPAQGTAITDVQLIPASGYFAHKVMSCRIPGNNFGDEGYTPGALGAPDSVPYSLGRNGWVVLDMKDTIFNGPGHDFRVIQSGTAAKAFTVAGSNSTDGPFTTIGTGTGTTSFDLATAQLSKARFLQIKDNGAGPAYGPGAGFNLDAVEMLTIPLAAGFTASNSSPCMGTTIDFTDNSTGIPTTWEWSFPGGIPSVSNDQNPGNIRYDLPGTWDVTLTVSNGITSATKTETAFISVLNLPEVNLGNDTSVCAWNSVHLDAGNPGATYLWSTGATTQTIQADSSGTGFGTVEYWVMVTGTSGCSSGDTITITYESCTSVKEKSGRQRVKISPNPAASYIDVDIRGFKGGSWQLLTMHGKVVFHAEIDREIYNTRIGIGNLRAGMYLLKAQKQDAILVEKIIIVHGSAN